MTWKTAWKKKIPLAVLAALLLSTAAYGAGWVKYGENEHGEFYYDRESIVTGGLGNVLRFQTRMDHAGSEDYTLRLFEFDCLHRQVRVLTCEIWEKGSSGPKYCGTFEHWQPIPPETYTWDLYDKLCPKKRGLR